MFKKAILIPFVLFGIAFSLTLGECLAEATLAEAQQNVCNLMDLGNLEAGSSAADKLIADFANDNNLPESVYWTIRHCEWTSKYDEAKRLCQQLVQKYPDNPFTDKARLSIARSEVMALVMSGKYDLARTGLNKLVSDFPSNPDLPESLYMVAERCEWQRQFVQQKLIYGQIIQNYAGSPFASKAQIGIARADILSFIIEKDFVGFDNGLDKLFTNFAGNGELPQTAIIIGEWFYKEGLSQEKDGLKEEAKDNFEKAVKVWGRVITEFPNSDLMPEVCCWAGDCYNKLGKYEESIQNFQKVVNNYSTYKHSWHALFMVGRNYEGMRDSGLISPDDAEPAIKAAYSQLLEKYPNCPAVQTAQAWINATTSK